MELYTITALCSNNLSERVLSFIPENFKGVKIVQKFNWVNPIGYTPTASVETMRIISTDKTWFDNVYDSYRLECDLTLVTYKLNSTATGYSLESSFKVDFESYVKC